MRAWPLFARLSRPALAVAALYALVLGSFVGSLAPRQLAAGLHVLCAPGETRTPTRSGHEADRDGCCTLGCPGGTTLLSSRSEPACIARTTLTIVWSRPAPCQPSSLPEHDARARGPPIA
jgi:hypothetical protein